MVGARREAEIAPADSDVYNRLSPQMTAPISQDQDLHQRLLAAEEARRVAEAALNESQRLARIGSWTWLVEPDAVTWSEEMFRIAGRDAALGAPSYAEQSHMYLPPERLAEAVAGTLTTGQPFEVEVALVRPGGEVRWIVARGAAVENDAGAVVRVHGTVRDITEARAQRLALQAAHDSLERSERRYRDLVENLLDVVFSLDIDGRVAYVSRAVQRYGFTVEELIGEHFTRLFHPDDTAAVERAFRTTVEGDADPADFRVVDKAGLIRHVQISARAMFEGEQLSGMTGVVVDVTGLRHAEEQLRVAQRLEAVGRLAGGIAHDFNNLLVVILGFADLALDQVPADDPMRANIEQICRAGERAAELVRQLLAFSRRQVMRPEVVDLNEVVRGVEPMLRRLIGEDVILRTALRERLPSVLADPGQLEQALMNLVVNARDAMPGGGTLTIETGKGRPDRGTAGYVELRVRDTGHGMDEATRTRIFEPFFTTKPHGEGTGLGLPTVYGIVQQSGGTIAVETAPGKGTTFTLAFPPDRSGAGHVPRAVSLEPGEGSRGNATVLLVEDEEAVRNLAARFLAAAGYEVVAAATGAEAERAFDAHGKIDLLLTDVVMPMMNGPELAARLTARKPELRVLFMSGYDSTQAGGPPSLTPAGARLLAKPFTRLELSRRVHEALE